MTNYDIPNEEELQPYVVHNYDLNSTEYSIKQNTPVSDYNQFIQLRDTLVYSGKYYKWKAGSQLVIWEKENTVEIKWSNVFRMGFEPDWSTTKVVSLQTKWPYVEYNQESADINGVISCVIQKDWRYVVIHKEEIKPQPNTDTVCCYVDIIRNWQIPADKRWWIAVSWWEWNFSKTFSWSTDDWSCSVNVSFKLWDILQRMPTWWYAELDLKAWDVLVLRMKDQTPDSSGNPRWNDLVLQEYSNFMSVEYKDLPLNN